MKKKVLGIAAIVLAVVILAVLVMAVSKSRSVSLNASYEQVAQQLKEAGYTVSVVTDAEGLEAYGANGLQAAVIAYKGAEKLDAPNEEKMDGYGMVDLFYFETEAQAKAYYGTEEYQYGYQAWSDAYYHIGIKDFNYRFEGNIAYAGVKAALELCK